ncbi:MAG: hypothetical protein K9G61_10800 [Bacteroidales bacterium]|nr:hypothetical protein [Bacteroidales bacterium]
MKKPKNFTYESKAGMVDTQRDHETAARRKAIAASPDLRKLKGVRIDSKTVIYIDPQRDTAQAVANFVTRHFEYVSTNYPNDL